MPVPAIPSSDAQLLEMFSSIQGEGGLVGCRQVFIRFAGCNLDCAYCDTDFAPQDFCRIEDAPGSGQFRSVANPVALEVVADILSDWLKRAPGMHHSISLTGGEPLLQGQVLRDWVPVLKEILPLHLETNGTCPDALPPLLPHIKWVSMDIKLNSTTGMPTPWKIHKAFLEMAAQTHVWVKAVVCESTPAEEMHDMGRLVHQVAPHATIFLQPATRQGKVDMSAERLLTLQAALSRYHGHVRIVPQTHVFLGLL